MTQKLADQNPGQTHLCNHQVQVATTPPNLPNQQNNSGHPAAPMHITKPSPAPSGGEEWAKLLVTCMEEQEYNNREIEKQEGVLRQHRDV